MGKYSGLCYQWRWELQRGNLAVARTVLLLFGVAAVDPTTFTTISLVLVIVSLLACYLPARRAMRIDPLQALRYE